MDKDIYLILYNLNAGQLQPELSKFYDYAREQKNEGGYHGPTVIYLLPV